MADFKNFECNKVNFHFYDSSLYAPYSCGPNAAALLTGESPEKLYLENKKSQFWPSKIMVKTLKKSGFTVKKIDNKSLNLEIGVITEPIKPYHCVLINHWASKNETTWSVLNGGYLIHNMIIHKLNSLFFVNKKINEIFLVIKEDWRLK
jgi:hypothetical protein